MKNTTELLIELAERDASLARFLKARHELVAKSIRETTDHVLISYWMGQHDLITAIVDIAVGSQIERLLRESTEKEQ